MTEKIFEIFENTKKYVENVKKYEELYARSLQKYVENMKLYDLRLKRILKSSYIQALRLGQIPSSSPMYMVWDLEKS